MPTVELATGLVGGTVAVAVLLAVRASGRWGDPVPFGGAAVTVAALAAVAWAQPVPLGVVGGVAGVAAVSALPITRRSVTASVALSTPFALLLALDAPATTWIRFAVVAVATVGAALVARADDALRPPGIGLALLAVSAAGVFAAVPDTEEAAALLGASVAVAALGWPAGLFRLGSAGGAGATALVAWVVAIGGRGRTPSIVGGLACLGVLAAAPAVGGLFRAARRAVRHVRPVAVLGVHAVAVAVASRGAGIRRELPVAVALAVLSAAIAVVGALALGRAAYRPPPRER